MLNEIDGTEMVMLFGICFGGGLFLFFALDLMSGLWYVHRLKANGYEIPDNKKDFKGDLRNVPVVKEHSKSNTGSRESMFLAILSLLILVAANIWNVSYMVRWKRYLPDASPYLSLTQIVLDLYWGISAFLYFRQRDSRKYRDDVEFAPDRKVRTSIEKGTVNGVILLTCMILFKIMIVEISAAIFCARTEYDWAYLEQIHVGICGAVREMTSDGNESEISDASYYQMLEGCYISDWSRPEDDFSRLLAEYLSVSDFAELQDKIYNSDGPPVIYVKITNGEVHVRMENPMRLDKGMQESYEVN